eukprot:jgi/Bigna1/134213/aug1.24_g8921
MYMVFGRVQSNFGAAAKHNSYCSRDGLLAQMLWSGFEGNAATRYGNLNEDIACSVYESSRMAEIEMRAEQRFKGFHVEHKGLRPDGSWSVGLLEIKCPFSMRGRNPGHNSFYPEVNLPNGLRAPIPPYYYDQITGAMGLLGLEWADFVVYTPSGTQIRRYAFDRQYFEQHLLPSLHDFYFNWYVPAARAKWEGILVEGQVPSFRLKDFQAKMNANSKNT